MSDCAYYALTVRPGNGAADTGIGKKKYRLVKIELSIYSCGNKVSTHKIAQFTTEENKVFLTAKIIIILPR